MGRVLKIILGILAVIAILAAACVVLVIVFKDKIPIGVEVPEAEVYEAINRSQYIVATNGIEDARNATVVYESTGGELEQYGNELRYISGKIEPLVSVQDPTLTRDIPTDLSDPGSMPTGSSDYTQVIESLTTIANGSETSESTAEGSVE